MHREIWDITKHGSIPVSSFSKYRMVSDIYYQELDDGEVSCIEVFTDGSEAKTVITSSTKDQIYHNQQNDILNQQTLDREDAKLILKTIVEKRKNKIPLDITDFERYIDYIIKEHNL